MRHTCYDASLKLPIGARFIEAHLKLSNLNFALKLCTQQSARDFSPGHSHNIA